MMSKYFLPSEWFRQESVWLSWPHNSETWDIEVLKKVEEEYAFFVTELLETVRVNILILNEEHKNHISNYLSVSVLDKINWNFIQTNDAWIRDYGPDFVFDHENKAKVVLDWRFNSWGGKYPPYDSDNLVPSIISKKLNLKSKALTMVLEGGSFEVNGKGDLLTTKSCLLNENRNPEKSTKEIEKLLSDHFGVKKIHWLEEGITGDDTDGHIDDIARFVDESTIVYVVTSDKNHPDFQVLCNLEKQLKVITLHDGSKPSLIPLPVPGAIRFEGEVLPCSYANFLISNDKVLVPIFNCLEDDFAISTLQKVFKDKKVVGIPSSYIIIGLGSLHCLSKHEFKLSELIS